MPPRWGYGEHPTISIVAVPRTSNCFAVAEVFLVSIVTATFGRSFKAATFGAEGAVQTTSFWDVEAKSGRWWVVTSHGFESSQAHSVRAGS
jgi:hypothetical protein